MRDLDELENLNRDQLVTPTDRLLFRHGRPARFARGSVPNLSHTPPRRAVTATAIVRVRPRRYVPQAVFLGFVWATVILSLLV